jgi:RNA methyltransferase, TrmH family
MKNYKEISSSDNKTYKSWKELLSSKGVKKNKRALVQGKLIVHEYFKNFYDQDIEILFTKDQGFPANLGPNTKSYLLDKDLFSELNVTGVDYPMLSVPVPELKPMPENLNLETQVYLPLGDPKNLGGAIRNCLAFGVDAIILLKEAANPYHPQAIKSSSGACFYLDLYSGPETVNLRPEQLYILDGGGEPSHQVKWPKALHLLVGEEGQGPPENLRQKCKSISIPISDKIESLNANQALGIALYEAYVSRR